MYILSDYEPIASIINAGGGLSLVDILRKDDQFFILNWLDQDDHGGSVYGLGSITKEEIIAYIDGERTLRDVVKCKPMQFYFVNASEAFRSPFTETTYLHIPNYCLPTESSWFNEELAVKGDLSNLERALSEA